MSSRLHDVDVEMHREVPFLDGPNNSDRVKMTSRLKRLHGPTFLGYTVMFIFDIPLLNIE